MKVEEIAILSTAAEAPLQIVFTLWLMIREVLKPPDLGMYVYSVQYTVYWVL